VAVIDLDKIATAMGWLNELSKDLQSADAQLKSQLDDILKASLKSIDDVKKQVAVDAKLTPEQVKVLGTVKDARDLDQLPLTTEQKDKLGEAVGRANAKWQQAMNSYQQTLQSQRTALIAKYRETIRPVAKRVANAKGFGVVFVASDNLLCVDSETADITGAVIEELQKMHVDAKPVPAPSVTSGPITTPTRP
jgi:Skp family chaperone for outer membrane proteins